LEEEVDEEIKTVFKVGGSLVLTIPKKYVEVHKLKPGDRIRIFFNDFLHAKPFEKEELKKKLEKTKEILEK
jgi:antitoxin component of MazEF toxin-antitoxin module